MDLLKFKVLNNITSVSSVNSQEFKYLISAQMPHISSTLPFIAFNYFLISHQLWTAETWLKHSILASARSRTPSTVPQRKMEVWKFEHRLLTNSACEPGFWRVNDTWNKRAIKYHYCKEASQKFIQIMVYGCVRHILICTEILMSSSAGIVLCTSERLKLFYTTICCAVAEWKKKSETNMNHMVILWLQICQQHTWHEDQNAKKCLCH